MVLGTILLQILQNLVNLLGIPSSLNFAVMGGVILVGVIVDQQWTAFRATSTPDAIWFIPQPAKVHESLPPRDPPIAVQWWPAESYVSCDGSMAVNTGPWVRPKGVGYFTTVWVRQGDGAYKWTLDHGDALAVPREAPDFIASKQATCGSRPAVPVEAGGEGDDMTVGLSADQTLSWTSTVRPDKSRRVTIRLWDGKEMATVIDDQVAAPKQP